MSGSKFDDEKTANTGKRWAPTRPSATHGTGPSGSGGRKPRVLAVEDNPEMLTLFRHLLASMCEVFTAMDMQSAMASIRATQFDAILMDINLGTDETGVDVLKALRDIPSYQSVPVVAVTAYALPGDRERFLEEGFDAYIGKPFTKQQLMRMLDRILA